MVLFNTIDVYTAIMLNRISIAWVAQWVETVKYCTLIFLSSASLVRISYATLIIVTIEGRLFSFFIKFSSFAVSFLHFN